MYLIGPYGFVDPGESLAEAVRREALEETSLRVEVRELFGLYSLPWRDPRGHSVSAIYHCTADGTPVGRDDARRAEAFHVDEMPFDSMAFDHARVLGQFIAWRSGGAKPGVEE